MVLKSKMIKILSIFLLYAILLTSCKGFSDEITENKLTEGYSTEITEKIEKKDEKIESEDYKKVDSKNLKIVVTSVTLAQIAEKLDINLVGVIESSAFTIPKRYEKVTKVGSPMSPDIEIIRSLEPDYVLSPISLIDDLKPRYDQAGLNYGFANLNSINGMHRTIEDLGILLGKEKEAKVLIDDFNNFKQSYELRNKEKSKKRVLILMGLPGSYVVATDKSYVGSLLKSAGGENVYTDSEKQFLNVNIEDMLKQNPDIILRTAHAIPEDVKEMFAKEFSENENWKHFEAVKQGNVFDLDYKKFGMSANFSYKEAVKDLENILWTK